jgi:hypothetical protein
MYRSGRLFDHWPEKYDQWFTTPIGTLVKEYEGDSIGQYWYTSHIPL